MTPYRSLAEARYVAELLIAAAQRGAAPLPPDVPCVYLFPPQDDISRVEIKEA